MLQSFVLYFSVAFIIFCIVAHYASANSELVYVKSSVDGTEYMVRNLPDKQKAADMLARLRKKLQKLAAYVYEHKNEQDEFCEAQILQLKQRLQPEKLAESPADSVHSSYSVNKGEKIYLCIRAKPALDLVDENTLLFVSIHEMAHVMSSEIGHTGMFWSNMAYLVRTAIDLKLYTYQDFAANPVRYCGISIGSSPYSPETYDVKLKGKNTFKACR